MAQDGHANVIVSLRLDSLFREEGLLSQAELQRQRNQIMAVREHVVHELDGTDFAVNREYESIPAIAMRIDAAGLVVLRASPAVASVEEDALSVPYVLQSVPLIGAPAAWAQGYDGSGWAVAILDTGIDGSHPFFRNPANNSRIVAEACYSRAGGTPAGTASLCPNGTSTQTGTGAANANITNCLSGGNQLCDHGTHVAGIAAGYNGSILGETLNGVAPNANIIAIQVFTRFTTAANCNPNPAPCVMSYNSDQLAALNYINTTLRPSHNIASINMSLGGGSYASYCDGSNTATKTAIDNLRSNGIATIIATGNDGYTSTIGAPACISSAIAVSSTSKIDIVSGFSNVATIMDLFAPGSGGAGDPPWDAGIASSVPGGWALMQGTSMATPHVAGAWAVARQAAPSVGVTDILNAFVTTGTPVTDRRPGASGTITKPRINVDGAVAVLKGTTTWTVTPIVTGPGGAIAPATAVTVANGATPSFNLFPDAGFVVDSVGGTCGGTLNGGRYTTNAVTANCTVTASFKPFVGNPEICGTLNHSLAQTGDGSAFSFLTGIAQGYSGSRVDDINLYVGQGSNMWAWWYGGPGGVASGAQVAVLTAGTTFGPGSTFNSQNKALSSWLPGRTGYLGIAFDNADTGMRNYGWLRMTTGSPRGYPATWHEYCYNSVGGSITAGTPPTQHTITVNRSPVAGGTASCSPNPVYNGLATVCTATANAGYSFSGWSGGCTGATCVLTNVTSAKTVTANFTSNAVNGQCGTANGGVFPTPPASGLCAAGTAGAVSGDGHPWAWTCAGIAGGTDASCSATIQSYPITVTASPVAGGNASCTPNPVDHGASSTCTASVNTGYSFDHWSGGCTGAICTLSNVTSAKTVTANFTQITYQLTLDPQGGSAVAPVTAHYGDTVTLPVAPTFAGHTFANWNEMADGSGIGYSAGASYTMPAANMTLYAIWVLNQYTVAASAPGGNGAIDPPSQNVSHGGTATFTVTPAGGYGVTSVTGDTCTPTDQGGGTWTATNITANCAVTASFTQTPVNGQCGTANGGVFPTPPASGLCGAGTASAVSGDGHPWAWTCAGIAGGTDASCSATIQSYPITVTASPVAGGSASCTPNPVDHGASSTCTASVNTGYSFDHWSGGCTGAICTLSNVTSAKTVTANFTQITYQLTLDSQGGSAVAPVTAHYGDTVTLPAAPTFAGHTFANWNEAADGSGIGYAAGGSYTMPASNMTLYAIWVLNQYTVTASAPGGNGAIDPGSQNVSHGGTAAFTVTPAGGYEVTSVTGDTCTPTDQGSSAWEAADITEDCSVTVAFLEESNVFIQTTATMVRVGTATMFQANVSGAVSAPMDGDVVISASTGESCSASFIGSTGTASAYACELSFTSPGPRDVLASFSNSATHVEGVSEALQMQVMRFVDLSIDIDDAGVSEVAMGETLDYLISVDSDGPDEAFGVMIQVDVPELDNVIWACTASAGATCPAATGTGSIHAVISTLPAGGRLEYVIQGDLLRSATSVLMQATVVVDSSAPAYTHDTDTTNNSAQDRNVVSAIFSDGFETL